MKRGLGGPLFSFLVFLILLSLNHGPFSTPSHRIHLANAWDMDGHQAIGMTAMSALSSKAVAQAKRLLNGKDVVDIAGWAHRVEMHYPETAYLHFSYQSPKWNCTLAEVNEHNCPKNQCIIRALQHFYNRLVGKPDFVPLQYPNSLRLTDSDAVKFVINLIGDLHQPLHIGFAEDLAGQNISVIYSTPQREKKATTLFSYWDSELIQKYIAERSVFWYGGWTHAHSLGSKLQVLRAEWEKAPNDEKHLLFEAWATESLHKACSSVYKDPRNGSVISPGYEFSSAHEYATMELIKQQLLIAGARTAFVLNTILAEKDASRLRQGSGVKVPAADATSLPRTASNNKYLKGFFINLVIVVVVLSALAYVVKFYAPSSSIPIQAAARNVIASKSTDKRS